MICEVYGTLMEDCECENREELDVPPDFGDTVDMYGYDGDAL